MEGVMRSPLAVAFLFSIQTPPTFGILFPFSPIVLSIRPYRTGSIGRLRTLHSALRETTTWPAPSLDCLQSSRPILPFIKRFVVRLSQNIYLIFGELSKYLYYLTSVNAVSDIPRTLTSPRRHHASFCGRYGGEVCHCASFRMDSFAQSSMTVWQLQYYTRFPV